MTLITQLHISKREALLKFSGETLNPIAINIREVITAGTLKIKQPIMLSAKFGSPNVTDRANGSFCINATGIGDTINAIKRNKVSLRSFAVVMQRL